MGDMGNYKPVIFTLIMRKILEQIMNQFKKHFQDDKMTRNIGLT